VYILPTYLHVTELEASAAADLSVEDPDPAEVEAILKLQETSHERTTESTGCARVD
jgi:hypothetical protein